MPKLPLLAALPALFTLSAISPAAAQVQETPAPTVTVIVNPNLAVETVEDTSNATAPRYQYVWRHSGKFSTRTTVPETARALRNVATDQKGDCIVVERAGKRYLITDKYVLDHATEAYAPLENQQKEMMGSLLGPNSDFQIKMGEFSKQMQASGKDIGVVAVQLKTAHDDGDAQQEAVLKEKLKSMGLQMKAQGEQVRVSGELLKPLKEKLAVMKEKLKTAAHEADDKMTRLLDTAFLRNMAVELPADSGSSTSSEKTAI